MLMQVRRDKEGTPLQIIIVCLQMMEQMSILFDCVRRAGPTQAQLLAEILPQVKLLMLIWLT